MLKVVRHAQDTQRRHVPEVLQASWHLGGEEQVGNRQGRPARESILCWKVRGGRVEGGSSLKIIHPPIDRVKLAMDFVDWRDASSDEGCRDALVHIFRCKALHGGGLLYGRTSKR